MPLLALLLVLPVAVVAADPGSAIPRLADGKPDFNGTWENGGGIDFLKPVRLADGSLCLYDCPASAADGSAPAAGAPAAPRVRPPPDRPVYRPEHLDRVKELTSRQVEFDPVLRCRPPGVPRIGPPDKIVQTARELVFLYEDVSGPFFRIVPLDPGVRRIDDSESYLGDAHGHWEGDTLVVVTRNFNLDSWLTDDGAFHSSGLVVTERLVREASGVVWLARVDDPEVLAEPWNLRPRRMVPAGFEMSEPAPCFEQDLKHMVDDSYHTNPR
jgi:hypothetical protein